MKEILIFSSQSCASCKMLKNQLDQKGIQYKLIDIEVEPDVALSYRIMKLPTIVINGKKIEGYSKKNVDDMFSMAIL